jgi:asparagine synthase (glutamine-hydrolysing)
MDRVSGCSPVSGPVPMEWWSNCVLLPGKLSLEWKSLRMSYAQSISRVENLLSPDGNVIFNMSYEDALRRVASGDAEAVAEIDGQFAIAAIEGKCVRLARTIGRPMRYFLAKRAEGPCLIVAEKMETLLDRLRALGLEEQFHPSYTRMVPAHHLMQLELVGCPDPNPQYHRFFTPERNRLPADLNVIGEEYIARLMVACDQWLDLIGKREPIGVLFSGGIDSGAVLLTLFHVLLRRGESPARLKAFTLRVDGSSEDAFQAARFVRQCNIEELWETIDCSSHDIDFRETIRVMEDYKPLDVQSGAVALALCRGIRQRYPNWTYLADGDGGDENLKDYPIEDNPELTIRSVLNNLMLYQEGWGVHAIKHSLVYSGGQSRGHIRTWAPADKFGFKAFSPFTLPSVIQVAEGIPFIDLTNWDHQKLYDLKGQVVHRGIQHHFGIDMPIFEKRRFQNGAISNDRFEHLFPSSESEYRKSFQALWT